MQASLPMYDFPVVRDATDRYWAAIRQALGDGPETLTRDADVWSMWEHPGLLLSQTCGLPYRGFLQGKVALVGTPDYGLPGCAPGYYNSVIVARADDPREALAEFKGAPFAVNSGTSQSGWAAPVLHARSKGVGFGQAIRTGSHLSSARAVVSGAADIAGLDALSWRFIEVDEVIKGALKVIDTTAPTPGLPYITARTGDPERVFAAVNDAIDLLSDEDRDALSLRGVIKIPDSAYCSVPTPAPPSL